MRIGGGEVERIDKKGMWKATMRCDINGLDTRR